MVVLAQDQRAATIARSVIDLAAAFGITGTAEGVEDYETVRRLNEYGCGAAQSDLLSHPLPASDIPQVPPNLLLAAH